MRAVVFLIATGFCAAADLSAIHVKNFDKVNEHIYRGGAPTQTGVAELGAMGVKTILDLRTTAEGVGEEKAIADKLKIKYVNIPLGQFSAPGKAQMEQILRLLQDDSSTIFVHCRRGKDRTGTVIACYRIQHDGWDNRRALVEAREHGLSNFEVAMHSYILHFTPLEVQPAPVAAAPTPTIAR